MERDYALVHHTREETGLGYSEAGTDADELRITTVMDGHQTSRSLARDGEIGEEE